MKIELQWNDVQARKPEPCEPVIGYSPEWECEDFNAAGIRECFLTDEGNWLSAKWDNDQDCWRTDDRTAPTQWMNLVGMTPSKIFQHRVKTACHEGTGWVLYSADGEPLEEWPKGWPETVTTAWLRSRGVEVAV
jgi:hypothetical protein